MDKTEKQVEEELFYRLEKEIGLLWMKKISPEQLHIFLIWALEGQVYSMPGNELSLGDAFRGFVTGCLLGNNPFLVPKPRI